MSPRTPVPAAPRVSRLCTVPKRSGPAVTAAVFRRFGKSGATSTASVIDSMLMDDETLGQLLGLEAEAMDVPEVDVTITPGLERVLAAYERDVARALQVFVARESRWPPAQVEEFVGELMDEGSAPLNVLLTLRGEGAGIWDGGWDPYFEPGELRRLQSFLVRRLGRYADSTGTGSLNEAMRHAILVSAGEATPSNGHSTHAPKWGLLQNARLPSQRELLEYWRYEHRRLPTGLRTDEDYVRAVKFALHERPRALDALERDVRRFDPKGFDRMRYEMLLENMEEAGLLRTYSSRARPTKFYVRLGTEARLQANAA